MQEGTDVRWKRWKQRFANYCKVLDRLNDAVSVIRKSIAYDTDVSDLLNIDITLKGESLSHDDLAEVCYQLSESSLPFFCDVSVYHDLTSPELLSHIDRRGKTIYKRNN